MIVRKWWHSVAVVGVFSAMLLALLVGYGSVLFGDEPVQGEGIAVVGTGRVDLAGYKAILIYCDRLQDVFPSAAADNRFDIPGGAGFVIQIQNPKGEWAIIGAFGPSADGVATTQTACLSNPFAYNLTLVSAGGGSPVTIFWPSAPGNQFTVRRSGQKIWLESGAGILPPPPPPLPPPLPPAPTPTGRNFAGIMDESGEGWALQLSGGVFQIIGRHCNLQVFESSSVGGEERSVTVTGCSFRPTLTILRVGGGLWFSRATGCMRVVNNGAQIDISGCGISAPPLPPVPTGCRLLAWDTNGNHRLDDPEFFNTIDTWVAGGLADTCFFQAIDVWIEQAVIVARLGGPKVQISATPRGLFFKAQGGMLVGVEVYDLNGRLVFRHEALGAVLRWDFQGGARPLANGAYLYVASVQGADGKVVRETRKLVVLR